MNANNHNSRPNKIASGLQSLMKEDVACSDMLFLAQFHQDWLTEHFKWLQGVDDVAEKPGFRSCQTLLQRHLMRKDLENLKTRTEQKSFGDHDTNLMNFEGEKKQLQQKSFGDHDTNLMNFEGEQKQLQKKKSEAFIEEATVLLDKHCLRWRNELLAAASGGEAPFGEIAARVLLNHHLPDNPCKLNQIDANCFSKDHGRHVDLLDFASFVRASHKQRGNEAEMDESTKMSAEVVATGVDIWEEDNDGALAQNDAALRDHFCSVHLPLASNSLFAEAGVKEAKIVSTAGRNEELRSACAICRSFLLQGTEADHECSGQCLPNLSCGN
jgi:hypothetical protein